MALVQYFEGTEAQILALQPTDTQWIDRAFYYPSDKGYFYRITEGVMLIYGAGEDSGVGIRLNGDVIGGVKSLIEDTEELVIPENYEYNIHDLSIKGVVQCNGNINIM